MKREIETLKYEKEFLHSDLRNYKVETKNLRKMFTTSQELLSQRFKQFDVDKNISNSQGFNASGK